MHTFFSICRLFAEHMHIFCREHDSSLHTSCTPILSIAYLMHTRCRILADSMHTLRRALANQCHSNAAFRPRGPAGGGGRRPCAMPRRFAQGRRSGGPGRRSGGHWRRRGVQGRRSGGCRPPGIRRRRRRRRRFTPPEGEAAAREGEAAAWEGEAIRLSTLEVLLPAATAVPHASEIMIHSSLSITPHSSLV